MRCVVHFSEITPGITEMHNSLRFSEAHSTEFHDRFNAFDHVQASTAKVADYLLDIPSLCV